MTHRHSENCLVQERAMEFLHIVANTIRDANHEPNVSEVFGRAVMSLADAVTVVCEKMKEEETTK